LQVFDEYATQTEVYKEVGKGVPQKLLDGINCTVVAYGQSGTGKTHTMVGQGQGTEIIAQAKSRRRRIQNAKSVDSMDSDIRSTDSNKSLDSEEKEGFIATSVADVFDAIRKSPPSVDFTVRCSFVEIYLEKIFDLLQPSQQSLSIGVEDDGSAHIVGASELCCTDVSDVYALLSRGIAYRTRAATVQNMDSSRSHAVVTLRIDQFDHETGKQKSSRLQMFDLAGSELSRAKSSRQIDNAVSAEGRMINQSLVCLGNMIRATVAEQGGTERSRMPASAFTAASKIAKLLQPSFGGNSFTTLICTASPSSYNIGETISTIKFAQKVQKIKNSQETREALAAEDYRKLLKKSEKEQDGLGKLVKSLVNECKALKGDSGVESDPKVWEIIERVSKEAPPEANVELCVSIKRKGGDPVADAEKGTEELEKELRVAKAAREKAESAMRDLQSEVTSLRSENEILTTEKDKMERDLNEAKTEIRLLSTRKVEIEHNLRTSHFRESEATAFLRQFRSFYLRLLKSKAAQGNGDAKLITEEVSRKIPGVPELHDLIDIDTLMVESGLLERDEIGQDTKNADYLPSKDSLSRSASGAAVTESKETEVLKRMAAKDSVSIVHRHESGQLISYRAKLLETPAGKLYIQKEKELEKELSILSKKCATLQTAANAEKAMVEALSGRQGALSKMKTAQEMNTLRQELDRKTNDLQAIVWKMNELHLVNKTVDVKVENREQHVIYLEENLIDLQTRNKRVVIERQEAEKKLREECADLRNQMDGLSVKLWQVGEPSTDKAPLWRLLVPFNSGEQEDDKTMEKHERRVSVGELAEEMDAPAFGELVSSATQTEDLNLQSVGKETGTQTEAPSNADVSIETDVSAVGDSIEISTQTESDKPLDATTQTDEIVPEEKDAAEISTQTDEAGRMDSVVSDMTTQTDEAGRMDSVVSDMTTQTESEPTSDTGVQTEEIEAKAEELKLDVAVQTEKSDESKSTAALTEISTQTDGAYENKMPETEAVEITTQTDPESTPCCQEAATQTDGLPQTIAVSRKDYTDESYTESYGEADLNDDKEEPFLQTSKATPMDASDDHVAGSSSSLGALRRPPKPSASFNKSQAKNTTADDEGSFAALSNSSMSSLKEFFSKTSTAPTPDDKLGGSGALKWGPSATATSEDQMSRSSSQSHSSPSQKDKGSVSGVDWRSKGRKKGDDQSNTLPPNRPPVASKSPSKWKRPSSEANSKPVDSSVPEFMSRFKEMGIKSGDEDDSKTKAAAEQKMRHSLAAAASTEQANATADWMQLAKKFSKLEDDVPPHAATHKASGPPIATPPSDGPEWMQKFKHIGMKGDDNSIERAGTKQVAPEAAATEALDDGAPEWMKKFRKKGHGEKTGSEMLQGGKPAGYEPRRFVDKFGATITRDVTHEEDEEETKKPKSWKK
jgi:kinesin family protein 5